MVKLLKDGRLCEIDDPDYSIATWWIMRTGGWFMGEVSDERTEELLIYFCGPEDVTDDK